MSEDDPGGLTNRIYRTVHEGPMTEVILIHAALADAGLRPFIADANIKTIDPFITGMNPFDVRLQVPEMEVDEAHRLIAGLQERRARARERGEEVDSDLEWEEDYGGEEGAESVEGDEAAEGREEHRARNDLEKGEEDPDDESPESSGLGIIDPVDTDMHRLARRTRWTAAASVAVPLLAPLLLHYLVRYYMVSRAQEHPPYGDRVTIIAAFGGLLASITVAVAVILAWL